MEENRVIIYNNAKNNQVRELSFLASLIKLFPDAEIIKESYNLPSSLASKTLNVKKLIKTISKNHKLSASKKAKCIHELTLLPEEIKVVRSIAKISVDFVIIYQEKIHFIEFHEQQHKIDSNKTSRKVYSINNDEIIVPRYLQRLLRDIWRIEHLNNYQIVWYDWFELTKDKNIFNNSVREFTLEGKFKLSDLV
ncbi:hypothetical protein [Maribacter sp. MAR_2009_72]|uniref:hypothetical protein n=1 Tax=Maribacter sp. MAR_2009_72 TaxID=1250050 RepID=UPI00119A4FF7|nr:hypothetical protein [Maribacter sp. MAR_2009_72]TVZ13951.1 hypothetical protein JM81_0147 [Maribacter sp. MAR_2009_72]